MPEIDKQDGSMSSAHVKTAREREKKIKEEESRILLLKISGVIAVLAALTLVVLLPVYFSVMEKEPLPTEIPGDKTTKTTTTTRHPPIDLIPTTSPPVPDNERFDCFPEDGNSKEKCEQRGCFWDPNSELAPSCFYSGPPAYRKHQETIVNEYGMTDMLRLSDENAYDFYGKQFDLLTIHTTYISRSTIRIKIYPDGERYEVPMEHMPGIIKPDDALYSASHVNRNNRFGVKIERRLSSHIIFDTSVGELMFSDQFLQISTKVASEYIYGFGEHMHESFKHDMNWKTHGMFSRDKAVEPGYNLYGVQPYFLCMEGDGNAYGVFFVNSNAMDVSLQPTPAITYRSVGGIIDFYIFLGPSPEQVTEQYTSVIGKPYFPPYWSFGFQLCRWGYKDLEELKTVVDRTLDSGIPYEVQYSDIDYMDRKMDFTFDNKNYNGLGEFVSDLKDNRKMRYIIILDPAITGNETEAYPPFDDGVENDVFIKTPGGEIAWGKVWPVYPGVVDNSSDYEWDYQTEHFRSFTAFPDFFLPQTSEWWSKLVVEFYQKIQFDGLWIDMNEPSSFINGSSNGCSETSSLDNPPYIPKLTSGKLYDGTICMDSFQYHPKTQQKTFHYNLHSLYGLSESLPTLKACRKSTGERCIVITRSTYPGSGKYAGHWLGDNTSKWDHLAASITGMLEFNLFGIPYVGADVCGFYGNTSYELCLRWMQLGSFYPFYRNHNSFGSNTQDPASFGPEFPDDVKTYTVDKQFLWGPALLITPVLEQNQTTVRGYFPRARWFDYYSGKEIALSGKTVQLNAPIDHINLHIQGGFIVPTQKAGKTTYYSRQNNFELIVALDKNHRAEGKLFWDDGSSVDTIETKQYTLITFSAHEGVLEIRILHNGYNDGNLTLGSVRVMGTSGEVTKVKVNGLNKAYAFDAGSSQLKIDSLTLDLCNEFEIRWEIDNEWARIDCMPSYAENADEASCVERGCIWRSSSARDIPRCFYTQEIESVPGYQISDGAGTKSLTLERKPGTNQIYETPVSLLQLDIQYQTKNTLHFKITDKACKSFEIPPEILDLTSGVESDEEDALYAVSYETNPFSIRVTRKSTGKILFDTSAGPLLFEERFLQMSTILPSELVFGFGEHSHRRYRHDINWKRWGIWARDSPPVGDWNFYGHQTFYMAVDDVETGTTVGVYLHNSNAMDITLQPTPTLTYRITGGVLDFYIFVGNTQEDVVQQYHTLIGFPTMPPYWGLGFQLSRWGYNSLERVREVVNEMREAEIPFDVQYGDIDYMEEYKDFTYDKVNLKGLPEFVDELHNLGMKYVVILDPGIKIEEGYRPYLDGLRDNVFIMNYDRTHPVVSEVWPGETHHPDFTHPNSSKWWTYHCRDFYDTTGVKYDALWVDMNEPSNFQNILPGNLGDMNCSDEYNKPPFTPRILWHGTGLHDRTICMESQQYLGLHYDLHSLYGLAMAKVTYEALKDINPNLRSFVITRSTFAGSGSYAGHWLGDNQSLWPQMAWAIPGILEFNLFGIPYVGADICGFSFDTTDEMCQRWMQVGAFYPFSRNHNGKRAKDQHPTAFGPEVTASSKKVLEIRYSILPFMYTLFYKVNLHGGTVVRALVHEFPSDINTWNVDKQFLLGSGFLVTPVMEEGARSVTGYFPGDTRWYDFHTGVELLQTGRFISLDCPLDHIHLHLRGGTILPMQTPAVTTGQSRLNPLSILAALDDNSSAFGELYWDDGESRDVGEQYLTLQFFVNESSLTFEVMHEPLGLDVSHLHFETVTILGITGDVEKVFVYQDSQEGSGDPMEHTSFIYENNNLKINELGLAIDESHIIQWLSYDEAHQICK